MAAPRGRRIALLAGTVAVLALVAGIVASWGRLREEWHIWRLSSSDEETRLQAAEVLGGMKSVRAVPGLVRILEEQPRTWPKVIRATDAAFVVMDPISHALFQIGPAAVPTLRQAKDGWPNLEKLIELIESPGVIEIQAMESMWRPRQQYIFRQVRGVK